MHHLNILDADREKPDKGLMHQEAWLQDAISSAAGVAEILCQSPRILKYQLLNQMLST
jgi:hypothetical protein